MQKALEYFREEISSIRTGRATPALIETLKIDAYGSKMDLRDLASINAPEPRLLVIQVWDQANVQPIEVAIRKSDLAVNPVIENNLIRIPVPSLSEERRREMTKLVGEKSEKARVAVRQIRRDAVDKIQGAEKNKEISEDQKFKASDSIQKITDEFSKQLDEAAKQKENEILQI